MDYKAQIDKERLPRHIAIIMDGNGRWAKKQGLARMFGHKQGVETVHNITDEVRYRVPDLIYVLYGELEQTEGRGRCVDDVARGYDCKRDTDADGE